LLFLGAMRSVALLAAAGCAVIQAQDEVCAKGSTDCSATISEDGSDSTLGRLSSIMFNQKKNISSYNKRLSDEELTERDTTNEYYDLATDFYEYGWGTSFHFAARFEGETLAASIQRHEHFLALKLGIGFDSKVGDLGMGVGGPLRSVVKFSGAHVTGVTINDYQVRRAKRLTKTRESKETASRMAYKQGDFTKLVPQVFEAESLDAIYYIESACHISNRAEIFKEGVKTLKKGGKLFSYEWVMTDKYDAKNKEHIEIKKGIEYGNGIEDMITVDKVLKAVEESGFKVLEHGDLVDLAEQWYGEANVPWYYDMAQQWSFSSFRTFALSRFGQLSLSYFLWAAWKVGLVPDDAWKTENMLRYGGENLVKGGQQKLFTPMYYILAEKL